MAGCISGADDAVESADIPQTEAAGTTSQVANATEEIAAPTPQAFPFAFEGTTGTWICAPTGPTSCQGLPVGTPSSNTFIELEYEGVAKNVDATLTWSATTPATAEMYIAVFAVRSCGEGCIERDSEMFSAYASGASPLTLGAADVKLGENETLSLHVGSVRPTPPLPAPFFYSIEQAFSVEGVVSAIA